MASVEQETINSNQTTSGKTISKNVEKILKDIAQLNLNEVVELVQALQVHFGISDSELSASASAGNSDDQENNASNEDIKMDVVIKLINETEKIKAIKAIKELGLSLKEAKDIVDKAVNDGEVVFKESIEKAEAEDIVKKLSACTALKVETKKK